MPTPTVIICIDGLDPEYLDSGDMPNLRAMGASGFLKTGRSMMPSVTNVNNVSLVTAAYPETHGICSNYALVRETGEEVYMESSEYILTETIFQRADSQGKTAIFVTAKDKLRGLLGTGTALSISSERPPSDVVEAIGPPPKIYSLEVNGWVIDAGTYIMGQREADLVYLTTTDYAMHTYAPGEPEARNHLAILDEAIGRLIEAHPEATVLLTADHGMSAKSSMVDLKRTLAQRGISSNPVPIIKDRYIVHHSNLGGCAFVHLAGGDIDEAVKVLRETQGVEDVMTREEAVAMLRLHGGRIGDIVVTGAEDVVFGDPTQVSMPPHLRSHGSQHERDIPLVGYNGDFEGFVFEENRDIGRYVFERVLG